MRSRPGRPGQIEKPKDAREAMLRLLKYLLPFRLQLILVTIIVILCSLLGLVGPWLMGRALDTFIAKRDAAGLLRIALLMLAVYAVSNLLLALSNWIMARISQSALQTLRGNLFDHLQKLPMRFFDTHPAGGLMSRLTSDIEAVNQAVSQNITALLTSAITMVGIVAAMFFLNHWLALVTLLVIPIMLAFTRFVAKYTRKGFRNLQSGIGALNATAEESISGQKVIRAFRRNATATETFRAQNEAVYSAGVYANSFAMLLMPLTAVLGNFFVIVLAGFGGFLALRGLTSIGTIATFINYGQNFISPLRQIANLYNSIQAALAGAERVFEILDTAQEIDEGKIEDGTLGTGGDKIKFHGDVRIVDVDFSYIKGTPILKHFSLEAKAGETIALVGPTGAGKTTVINLLTRFYETDSGTICIDGRDIKTIPLSVLRGRIGLVLQDTFLFADTVLENIRYGRLDATDEECMEAARVAEADHFIRQLHDGYSTNLSERAGNLSQGQRQLLSIARAVLADPDILILDEATSSVDTRTEARIQNALLSLMKGRTSFVIAHRLSTIRDANLVVVIKDGEIAESGTHQQLLDKDGVYRHLYLSQFKGKEI